MDHPSPAASRSGKTRVNVVERFAGFAEGYRGQPLAPQVLHQAKRAVIDWYAALLPGGVVPPALLLERAFAGELGHGEARLALGKRASVRAAALINGAAAHTVEVDDIFREGIYHPGAPTIAAAEGVTGSLDIMEGEAGYGRAMGYGDAGDGPDWERALATLGEDFHITRMSFKNHACCGHAFAAIDGALALKARMGVAAGEIARVRVGSYRAALEVAGIADPATAAEARFSTPYLVATALTHGSVRLAAFEPARLRDPATRALMRRVEVVLDPGLDAAFPAQGAARVAIESRDGRRGEHRPPTRKGDPDMPLSDAELEHKYLELASPVLGEERARRLLARLWRLESETQLSSSP